MVAHDSLYAEVNFYDFFVSAISAHTSTTRYRPPRVKIPRCGEPKLVFQERDEAEARCPPKAASRRRSSSSYCNSKGAGSSLLFHPKLYASMPQNGFCCGGVNIPIVDEEDASLGVLGRNNEELAATTKFKHQLNLDKCGGWRKRCIATASIHI